MKYRQDPRDLVQPWALDVVMLWGQCRGEFGMANLPDPGGINDQVGWLLDAFAVCNAAEAQLREEEKLHARGG